MVGLMGALLVASATRGNAQSYKLSAGDTSLLVDVGVGGADLSNWTLNGVDELNQQWFYYSIGSGPVESIDTISPFTTTSDSGSSLSGIYSNSAVKVTTTFSLGGNASGAELNTSIAIQNVSGTAETLHLYQFSDFGLGGTSSGQNVQFLETTLPFAMIQTGPGAQLNGSLSATKTGGLASVEEMAGLYNSAQFGLTSGDPNAPLFNDSSLSAIGNNVDFAYEFDATSVANLGAITVSELQGVPEPSSVALLAAGSVAVALLRRRGLAILKK